VRIDYEALASGKHPGEGKEFGIFVRRTVEICLEPDLFIPDQAFDLLDIKLSDYKCTETVSMEYLFGQIDEFLVIFPGV